MFYLITFNLEAENLIFLNANGESVDAMTKKVLYVFTMDKLKKVFISEDMKAAEIIASHANKIDIDDYLHEVRNYEKLKGK